MNFVFLIKLAPPFFFDICDGKMVVQLNLEDIKAIDEHWSNVLISYDLEDTLYEKSMDNFVTNVWNLVKKT